MSLTILSPAAPTYPAQLTTFLADRDGPTLTVLGQPNLLQNRSLALFCSVKCPGRLILQSYDLAQALQQAGIAVIGGFHSPIEKEVLTILLRGQQPLIICPARSLAGLRLRSEWKQPLHQGRLLLLSPFPASCRRATAATAHERNRLVGALAERIFVTYATPGGKMETLCREFIGGGKRVYTFESEATAGLIEMGARAVGIDEFVELVE